MAVLIKSAATHRIGLGSQAWAAVRLCQAIPRGDAEAGEALNLVERAVTRQIGCARVISGEEPIEFDEQGMMIMRKKKQIFQFERLVEYVLNRQL